MIGLIEEVASGTRLSKAVVLVPVPESPSVSQTSESPCGTLSPAWTSLLTIALLILTSVSALPLFTPPQRIRPPSWPPCLGNP